MSSQSLFKADSITVAGQALAFEDGSATISGLARVRATVVPSASGPDFETYAREATQINLRLQFGPGVSVEDLKNIKDARVVLKDSNGPRRFLAPRCSFAGLGTVGSGPVDLTLNVLEPIQSL